MYPEIYWIGLLIKEFRNEELFTHLKKARTKLSNVEFFNEKKSNGLGEHITLIPPIKLTEEEMKTLCFAISMVLKHGNGKAKYLPGNSWMLSGGGPDLPDALVLNFDLGEKIKDSIELWRKFLPVHAWVSPLAGNGIFSPHLTVAKAEGLRMGCREINILPVEDISPFSVNYGTPSIMKKEKDGWVEII